MATKKIFASISTTTKNLKTKYHNHFRSSKIELALIEVPQLTKVQVQLMWVDQHREEIQRANNIIQREMHVSAKLFHYQTLAAYESTPDLSTSRKLHECDTELRQLNIEYLEHLKRTAEMMDNGPAGRLVRRYTKSLRHRPKHLWTVDQLYCELRCGCCLHDCQCCSRYWDTIHDTTGDVQWMHCTGSCGCCIRHRVVGSIDLDTNGNTF